MEAAVSSSVVARILLAEDEESLAGVVVDYLRHAQMDVHHVLRGDEVLQAWQSFRPHLILLDLMLPAIDGLELCREIRKTSEVPIIMVTARVEEVDRLLGLELGADDYLCKPFSPRELVARVKAVLKRLKPQDLADGPFRHDLQAQSIWLHGQRLDLTPTEYRLLSLFLQHPGRVFSRDAILDQAYGYDQEVTDRAIDSHIKNLRKKLARHMPDCELIYSVYGVGYRFEL